MKKRELMKRLDAIYSHSPYSKRETFETFVELLKEYSKIQSGEKKSSIVITHDRIIENYMEEVLSLINCPQ